MIASLRRWFWGWFPHTCYPVRIDFKSGGCVCCKCDKPMWIEWPQYPGEEP